MKKTNQCISRKDRWEQRFQGLIELKKACGQFDVSSKWKTKRQLAYWVINQCARRKTMKKVRIRRLDEIGFRFPTTVITNKDSI